MVPDVDKADFSSLKLIAYGASPISEQVLAQSLKTFKCEFVQVYGLTETTGVVTMLMHEDHDVDGPRKHLLRSCGKPSMGIELKIVDEKGKEVAAGDVGEIIIRSKQVMKGYWNMPEETAKSIRNGWFYTGDAGYKDKEGYVYIHDRVKDMIVSGGENVYPAEVVGHRGTQSRCRGHRRRHRRLWSHAAGRLQDAKESGVDRCAAS
jgi:acyl-CoA synthetase (AMP-forming)/AMP-acid ligase II